MKRSLQVLGVVFAALAALACASDDTMSVRKQEVEADIVLRKWDQKGFGEQVGARILTVVTSPEYKGDIVVLRDNGDGHGFTAEVYEPRPDPAAPRVWEFVSGGTEKAIVRQPDGSFHLSEMVDDGTRIEILELSD